MFKKISVYIQYCLPQHLLSRFSGWLASVKQPRFKNFLIKRFIKRYHVDMSLAVQENLNAYPSFNSFFIRQIKLTERPFSTEPSKVVSPCDGAIAEIGCIAKNQLMQAKDFYYDLEALFGNQSELAATFYNGCYATLYLAPKDYHRVHMPLDGRLQRTLYLPGKLFSVNRMTSKIVPQVFSRNERLIAIFDTAAGEVAVIMVGAMIVGNIHAAWLSQPVRSAKPILTAYNKNSLVYKKGDELGYFSLGSTVILLFKKNTLSWLSSLKTGKSIKLGQTLGNLNLSSFSN